MENYFTGSLEKWMEGLPQMVKDNTELKDLVIPGSHDSATFDLDPIGGKADDFSSYMEIPYDKIQKWFKTQNLSFTEQLKSGIRYFDLRIIKHRETGEIHFVHGLYSRSIVTDYLKDIRNFLDKNQKEIVILDFNHIYDMDNDDHNILCTEIETIFSGIMLNTRKCAESDLSPSKMTLSKLGEMNGRVLVFYGNSRACTKTEHIWPRHELEILWPYTPRRELVATNLKHAYGELDRKDIMVVWHGILTPHSDDKFLKRTEKYKDLHDYVSSTTKDIVTWISSQTEVNLNVVCADFIEENNFTKHVIAVNYRSYE